jgi:Ca-activated chloride channel family protein
MFPTSTVVRRGRLLVALTLALLVSASAPGARRPDPAPAQEPSPAQTQTPTPTPTPSPSPTPEEAEPVERIETDLTSVLLSATDKKRRFVTTLRAEDLRLREDGVEQKIETFEQQTATPLSLALLVDVSSSQEKVLKNEQEAASQFIRSILRPEKDTAAVLSFTGITRIELEPTGDAPRLLSAIDRIKVPFSARSPECNDPDAPDNVRLRCTTGAWDAVVLSIREVLSKTPARTRRAILLLSDGDDRSSTVRLYQAVEYAVRHNTVVYSIGIRDRDLHEGEMRKDFLNSLSEQTGGRAFFPKRAEDLPAAFAQIEQELRSQYLLTYTPTNRARDGSYRRLELEIVNPQLKKQKLNLFYRQGYYAKASDK